MNDLTEIPAVIGDYAVLAELGRGDTSVVLRARQNSLDRIVALKVVRSEWVSDPTDLERFLRGAKSAARLDHPQIVRIFDVGRVDDLHYYAMALVEGQSLSQRVASQGPLAVREAVELVRRVAQAAAYTHGQKIVHRGLSPDCVLLTSDSKPRVTGFGLARPTATGHSVTADGVRVDSFTAPEVITGTGSSNSPAADIYGLGGILYFALTGQPPHADASVAQLIAKIAEAPVVSPRKRNPKVPGNVEAICLRCLAKAPGDRYATAEAVAEALSGLLGTKPKVASTGTTALSQGVGKGRSTGQADLDTHPNAQEKTRRRKRAPARTVQRHGLLWTAIGLSILVTLAGIGIAFRPAPTPKPVTTATGIPTAESTPASVAGSGSASAVPPQSPVPQAEWKSLFNGKDLTGWKPLGYNGWRVENGVLIGEASKGNRGCLVTDTEFSDYELEFEYKLAPDGNSGVYLKARPVWNGSEKEFEEIQLLDDDSPTFGNVLANQRNLSWWKKAAPKLPTPTPVGNWYKVRVTVSGSNRVQIALNDQLILDHTNVMAPKGHIGLTIFGEGSSTRIEFRNIRVKLASDPVAKEVTALDPEWKPLFNGKDLTGWKPLGHNGWRVENEVLIGESSSGALGWLMSDAEFTDYELEFQYKLAANSNSGIFPRAWPDGNVTGKEFAEIQLLDDDAPPFRNLATNQRNLSWWSRAAPKASPQALAGVWHPVRLTVTGNRIQIALNDQEILDHTDALPPKGHIGLQLYPTRVEFQNLRIRPHKGDTRVLSKSADSFTPIFNGRDLAGWTPMRSPTLGTHEPTSGGWESKDGQLLCATSESGWLRFDQQLGDFELDLEFLIPEGRNSGILVRHSGEGDLYREGGMEIQIEDDPTQTKPHQKTGSIYGRAAAKENAFRRGEWNQLTILCEGERVAVMLNGNPVVDAKMNENSSLNNLPRKGYVGIYNRSGAARGTAFRNLRLLTKPASENDR